MYLGLNVMNADARVEELFANKRPPAVGTVTLFRPSKAALCSEELRNPAKFGHIILLVQR